jgi:hypothetical protein
MIQRNAIGSWLQLGHEAEVILMGDEEGIEETANALGVRHLSISEHASSGTPLVSALFNRVREVASNPFLCYINADVITLDDFLPGIRTVAGTFASFLIVGTRWDVTIEEPLSFGEGWISAMRQRLEMEGRLHPPMGSDYFIFPSNRFQRVPDFALGRAGWDNWMMFHARQERMPLVDASAAITVVHQDHSYAHLPGGQPHYRHPESQRNMKLAGGMETMFRLRDADWVLEPGGMERKSWVARGRVRKVESDVLAFLGPGRGAKIVRMAFHPMDSLRYFWRRALKVLSSTHDEEGDGKWRE